MIISRSICPPFVAGSIVSMPVVNVDIRKEMKTAFMVMLMTTSLLGMHVELLSCLDTGIYRVIKSEIPCQLSEIFICD